MKLLEDAGCAGRPDAMLHHCTIVPVASRPKAVFGLPWRKAFRILRYLTLRSIAREVHLGCTKYYVRAVSTLRRPPFETRSSHKALRQLPGIHDIPDR